MRYSEEFVSAGVALRADVLGSVPPAGLVEDLSFLSYRLAGVERRVPGTLPEPDLLWDLGRSPKGWSWQGPTLVLAGSWEEGEIQRVLVSLLARRMEERGLHLFHSSCVHYLGKTVLFMTGENNSGKTMCQIEACRRGASIVATETLVTDADGRVVSGSKEVFLRHRARGTERTDKPSQDEGVAKFFARVPEFRLHEGPAKVDLVVLPDIDGHFSEFCSEMGQYEKEYQTFHSLVNYLGLHTLLCPGIPMPVLDNDDLRARRAEFVRSFARNRAYCLIRAPRPEPILDRVEALLART